MFAVSILAYIFLCLFLSWYFKEKLVTVFPCGTGILMLILMILAYFRVLNVIDCISVGIVAVSLFIIVKKRDILQYFKGELYSPASIAMFIIYFIIYVCVRYRMVVDWDELGVWGLEVKSIYYINGFAEQYKYAAIGFADYFPGQMLFEWWTCHFRPDAFQEGLAYVGYYWLYATFLIPVLRYINLERRCIVPVGVAGSVLFLLLPGITGVFGYRFLSVELLISASFAYCLFQYIDFPNHNVHFSVLSLILTTMQMMLFKESGVLYALIAFLFGCIVLKRRKARVARAVSSAENYTLGYPGIIISFLISGIPMIIWKVYCKVMERGKYFDDTAKALADDLSTHSYQLNENTPLYVKSFFQALVLEPLHENKTHLIDMTVIACMLLILGLIFYAHRRKYIMKKECWIFSLFYIGVFVLASAALLCMHIFIFQEKQYLDTSKMIKSISRYLEPLFLGIITFLFYYLIMIENEPVKRFQNILLCGGIILLCTNYKFAFDSIINYRLREDETVRNREGVIRQYEAFYNDLMQIGSDNYSRTLYVESSGDYSSKRCFRYLAAPHSIIFWTASDNNDADRFRRYIEYYVNKNHCEYIFFDKIEQNYLNTVFGESSGCLENTLLTIHILENGDIVFGDIIGE